MSRDTKSAPIPETTLLRELAQTQFAHDLPQLLVDHLGSWVLYHGENRLGVARHSGELYETCLQQGLPLTEVVLFEISSPDQEIIVGPMAFD